MTTPRHLALLLGLAGVLLFAGLGRTALTDRDEGANAEAAREMREQGAWLSPIQNYAPRFAKPALVYWLMIGSDAAFGAGETAVRLPSAVAITLLVLLQYAFARWAFGPRVAFRAALILLLAGEIVAIGRMALTDAVLVLWTTAAAFAFFRAHRGEPPRRGWYAATYAAMALATLTKGPVGLLVPVAAIAVYLALAGGARRVVREAGLPWGAALFLAVAGPWYVAMLWRHGDAYLARAQGETVGRLLRTVTGPGGTVLFYLPVVLVGLFPWSALLPGALLRTLRAARQRAAESRAGGALVFAAASLVAILTLFSLAQSRLPHYIAPLFPAGALLLGASWPVVVARRTRLLLAGLGLVCGAALVGAVALGPTTARWLAPAYPAAAGTLLPGGILGLGILATLAGVAGLLRDGDRLFSALAVITALLFAGALHVVLPEFDRRFVAPAGQLARVAAATAEPCDELVAIEPYRPSLAWYARRPVTFVGVQDASRLAELAARPGRLFVVSPLGRLADLPAAVASLPPVDTRGGYVLLRSAPSDGCPAPEERVQSRP